MEMTCCSAGRKIFALSSFRIVQEYFLYYCPDMGKRTAAMRRSLIIFLLP